MFHVDTGMCKFDMSQRGIRSHAGACCCFLLSIIMKLKMDSHSLHILIGFKDACAFGVLGITLCCNRFVWLFPRSFSEAFFLSFLNEMFKFSSCGTQGRATAARKNQKTSGHGSFERHKGSADLQELRESRPLRKRMSVSGAKAFEGCQKTC